MSKSHGKSEPSTRPISAPVKKGYQPGTAQGGYQPSTGKGAPAKPPNTGGGGKKK